MQRYSAPKGTKDILSTSVSAWQHVEQTARDVFNSFGFGEIRTPHFEQSEVFMRGIGEDTDVVGKEMYTFNDKKGRSMTLRPEGTAGVCRALIESGALNGPLPVKGYYMGSFFRYEQPQDGRQREFHQIGAEQYGATSPVADAEIIVMLIQLFNAYGIKDTVLHLSSLGCNECRGRFKKELVEFIERSSDRLCGDCNRRFVNNPLRVLDCKNPTCAELVEDAPSMLDFLCGECSDHFEQLKSLLDASNVKYILDRRLVRGLDYYTRTVFELKHAKAGAAKTLTGGGRYDGLSKQLGGPDVSGIGFALGVERLMLTLAAEGLLDKLTSKSPALYIASADEKGLTSSFAIANELRESGHSVLCNISGKGLKAQLKEAGRMNCDYCTVMGESEIESGNITLRPMGGGDEVTITINELDNFLSNNR